MIKKFLRRSMLRVPLDLGFFCVSFLVFQTTKKTLAYNSGCLRALFTMTNGRFNDAMSRVLSLTSPKYKLSNTQGILGDLDPQRITEITNQLERDGVYIFEEKLSTEVCARLKEFALQTSCIPFPSPENPSLSGTLKKTSDYYFQENSDQPIAPTCHFEEQDFMQHEDVQNIIADESIIAVAQEYLQCCPVLDLTAMWWSTAFSKKHLSESAQLFHSDQDRIKFLKFFIYLTDVTVTNGPHCYVKGSHKQLPGDLVIKRFERMSDAEISEHYAPENQITIEGKQGTMFIADTRGIHKGVPLTSGNRLLLQLEFANSLYGAEYPIPTVNVQSDLLKKQMNKYPRIYSRYKIN